MWGGFLLDGAGKQRTRLGDTGGDLVMWLMECWGQGPGVDLQLCLQTWDGAMLLLAVEEERTEMWCFWVLTLWCLLKRKAWCSSMKTTTGTTRSFCITRPCWHAYVSWHISEKGKNVRNHLSCMVKCRFQIKTDIWRVAVCNCGRSASIISVQVR
jgi:hypothetical protein